MVFVASCLASMSFALVESSMEPLPPVTPEALRAALQERFDKLCHEVIDTINQAPTGHILNHSEEPVRDLVADFRLAVFQTALQLKIDAAEAAFSPDRPPDRPSPAEQGS
jgi:hypothetical protein